MAATPGGLDYATTDGIPNPSPPLYLCPPHLPGHPSTQKLPQTVPMQLGVRIGEGR